MTEHGVAKSYWRGCRCEACRRAHSEYSRVGVVRRRSQSPPEHGHNGYMTYGCRCEVCTTARQEYMRMWRYGLDSSDYESLIEDQGGKCAICHEKLERPAIDHCHDSGRVRGILCYSCNSGMGKFSDSSELLRRALDYLS